MMEVLHYIKCKLCGKYVEESSAFRREFCGRECHTAYKLYGVESKKTKILIVKNAKTKKEKDQDRL